MTRCTDGHVRHLFARGKGKKRSQTCRRCGTSERPQKAEQKTAAPRHGWRCLECPAKNRTVTACWAARRHALDHLERYGHSKAEVLRVDEAPPRVVIVEERDAAPVEPSREAEA